MQVNEETAGGYITALREAGRKLGLEDDLALSALLQLPSDVFTLRRAEVDEDALWAAVQPAAMAAAAAFAAMREAEGERLKRDLSGRLIEIERLLSLVEAEGPVGRKLDFLVQEMNRETNTIGSKCQDADIARMVVEMKSEIEKVREQIQNLE